MIGIKWTGRREDGTTLDRDTIRQEVVKPLAESTDAGGFRQVLPSTQEQPSISDGRTYEDQDTRGDNTGSRQGDDPDGGTDARSGSTLARSLLTIRSK